MTPVETAKKLIAAELWSEAATLLGPLTNNDNRHSSADRGARRDRKSRCGRYFSGNR
jgi:hypothetical protein